MSAPVVAVFAPDAIGHFAPLRPVIAGLASRGATVHVFTGRAFAGDVDACGGRFADLFEGRPPAAADDESLPVVSRYVTYAAHYAQDVLREIQPLGVSLVVCDTFAVIGRAVANALGVPYVSVVASHNLPPARYIGHLLEHREVRTSERCLRAVEVLRDRYGMANASPFSYIDGLSPHLNLLPEPPQWLSAAERAEFEPAAFLGSVQAHAPRGPSGFRGDGPKVYVSWGTVPWWYWADLAADALVTVAEALCDSAEVLISLGGGAAPGDRVAAMRRAGATVVPFASTWDALGAADVFVTAHGLSSTHEAVCSGVPMLSYPFHGDQPGTAAFCEREGLAVPLVAEPLAPLTHAAVRDAFAQVTTRRAEFGAALERARGWELDVIAARGSVIDRVLALAQA